jgi:hypothetical protein
MGVDFSTMVYLATQDLFGRSITITPLASNPNGPAYTLRGIYTANEVDIMTNVYDEGMAMISDRKIIVDIREREWSDAGYALPQQGDLVDIPADGEVPAAGLFKITDAIGNGGGETTLTVQKYEAAAP